jgi:hypothetical protein
MSQGLDKRRHLRLQANIPLSLEVHQWTGDGAYQGQKLEGILYDVSENGISVTSKTPLAQDMFVRIKLPPEAGLPVVIGRIIRCDVHEDYYHYGCLVSGMSLADKRQIENYAQRVADKEKESNSQA